MRRGAGAAAAPVGAAAELVAASEAGAAAERLVKQCGQANCHAVQADLSTSQAAGALVQAAVKRFGRLDILVANHGIWPPQDVAVDRMSERQWRESMAISRDSVFGLVKHAVAQMKQQREGGHIVLVSSTAGQRGEAFHCDYAAAKGAIISMVKGLSTELARDSIHVNCVAPGWVDTDMAAPALNDPAICQKVFATIPLGRVATPAEIAAPILFLCTEHAGFITGEIFNVNGGAVLVG